VLRWLARVLNIFLSATLVVFAVDEGLPPVSSLSWASLSFVLLAVWFAGMLLTWRWEAIGASAALIGIAGFYLYDFNLSGLERWPGGWVFPLMLLTPLFYLTAAFLDRIDQKSPDSAEAGA
jgi:hypothetical protein